MEHKLLGTIVEWENEKWYVDNTDENFKEDGEFEDGDNEYMTIVTESNFVAIDD